MGLYFSMGVCFSDGGISFLSGGWGHPHGRGIGFDGARGFEKNRRIGGHPPCSPPPPPLWETLNSNKWYSICLYFRGGWFNSSISLNWRHGDMWLIVAIVSTFSWSFRLKFTFSHRIKYWVNLNVWIFTPVLQQEKLVV